MDQLRSSTSLPTDEILELLFALLALKARSTPQDWRDLQASPPDVLNHVLRRKLMADVSVDSLLSRMFPIEAVAQAIETISSPGTPVEEIADYLIEQFTESVGKVGENNVVSPSVRRLVISMVQPTGVIYDPTAGFGQLLIDAASEAGPGPYDLFGQERNRWVCTMAQLNLVIHGIQAEVVAGDVFRHDMFPQLRADRVMAVPPFGLKKLPSADQLAGDPRWAWGEPGANDADAAWIEHCLFHLAENGKAVLVLPNRILFTGGRAGRIRQRIVKAGLLDTVVALPPGLIRSTAVASSLLVFVKGRADVNGKPAPTLMIDLRNSVLRARLTNALPADLIDRVTGLYREWAAGKSLDSDLSAVAYFDDLAANDYVIDPARYAPIPRTAWNAEKAARDRTALIGQLEALTQASQAADDRLKAIMRGQ
jgi:type I restriction enzyme M protein